MKDSYDNWRSRPLLSYSNLVNQLLDQILPCTTLDAAIKIQELTGSAFSLGSVSGFLDEQQRIQFNDKTGLWEKKSP